MLVFNLFCDASIDTQRKIACGGCYVSVQEDYQPPCHFLTKAIIQEHATNNSSEILAIWIGVNEALQIRKQYPNAVFRLFSDSKISVYGLRSWMVNWIKNINPNDPDRILVSSSGEPVANQQRFIDIFNTIVRNNLRIELYHQRGHVGSKNLSLDKARIDFVKNNKVSPENLGITIAYLCQCNDYIDNFTRESIKTFISTGKVPNNVSLELKDPMIHYIMSDNLNQYVRCIDKTTVISRHDFKGGYNQ